MLLWTKNKVFSYLESKVGCHSGCLRDIPPRLIGRRKMCQVHSCQSTSHQTLIGCCRNQLFVHSTNQTLRFWRSRERRHEHKFPEKKNFRFYNNFWPEIICVFTILKFIVAIISKAFSWYLYQTFWNQLIDLNTI